MPERADPEFTYSPMVTSHNRFPRFVLVPVDGPEDPRIADPPAGCSFRDGREFAVVQWIDQPVCRTPDDVDALARLVRRAAEFGRLP